MSRRPNLFAALIATVIVLTALSPLLYGLAELRFGLPTPPTWTLVAFWLGLPGLWVAHVIAGYDRRSSLTIAIIAAWVIYFAAFRLILYWPNFRRWMRRKAAESVAKERARGL